MIVILDGMIIIMMYMFFVYVGCSISNNRECEPEKEIIRNENSVKIMKICEQTCKFTILSRTKHERALRMCLYLTLDLF